MSDPLHALLTDEGRQKEEEEEASISDSFNLFARDTAEKIVDAALEYASSDPRMTISTAMALCESIIIGVLDRLPIAAGNEVRIMQQMKVNVKRRMAQWRLLKGPAQGRS